MALPLITAMVWVGLFWTVALLTWLLAGGLQRALAQSREQAQALQEFSTTLEARVAAQTAELAQRAARAEALYEVSQAVTSTLDLNPVLGLITEQAARLLNFDSAQVLLQQEDGSLESLGAYGSPGSIGGEISALTPILQEQRKPREARVIRWPQSDHDPGGTDRMALMLPMRYGTTVSGVLVLTNADGCADCGQDDLILGQGLADQAAVAIANAQLLARTRETAMLEERTRLARDIHDTLAQGLTGIVVQLGAAQRALAVAPDESREHLALAQRMARESLAEARRSVWNLRAPALDRGDLADALRSVAVRPLGSDVAVTFELTGEPWPLTTAIESTLLRVAQEALANVARHSQATEARLALVYTADSVELSVSDNGVGFDPQAAAEDGITPGPWGGFGLIGMRERVAVLGGSLAVTSHDGVQVTSNDPPAGIGGARPSAEHAGRSSMIRVLVVDDHPVVRHGLMAILRWEKDIELVGDAADGLEAVRLILEQHPDVVLLDLRLPHLSGIEVMKQVRSQGLPTRFLVLTTYDTDEYIAPALAAGAQGYLLKDAEPEELSRAVRSLMRGGAALEPKVAARLLDQFADEDAREELSARELEVLKLLAAGGSNKSIGLQLSLSENTIKSHISHIFAKLGVQNRAEAVSAAMQRGLLQLDRQ